MTSLPLIDEDTICIAKLTNLLMVVGDDDRDSSDRDKLNDAGDDGGVDSGHSAV